MESVTTSPTEYRAELERSITYNHEKLQHARSIPDNQDLINLFESRMNRHLEGLLDLIGVEHA